ncbi:hypothetical protein B1F84_03635 [Pseudoalteromonas sp. DL-6]|nr:hypothetical protein B1F84_03635 [Pseudoalteromonas sp. DL-6]
MPWSTGCARATTTEFHIWSWLDVLLYLRQQKTRYIAVTGFLYLDPGNVMVPTAVESHIANATLSLCRAAL